MSNLLTRLLVGLNLATGIGIIVGVTFAWHTAGSSAPVPIGTDRAALVPTERPAVSLSMAREKPIFTPTRQLPAASNEGSLEGDNLSGPAPRLMGILRMGPGRQRALLQDASNGQQHWRTEGQAINDWIVLEIRPQEVRLERAGETLTVRLLPAEPRSSASGSPSSSPTNSSAMLIDGDVAPPSEPTPIQTAPTPRSIN